MADRVNQLNFLGETVVVQLHHPKYDYLVTVKATPQPCAGEIMEVRWHEDLPDNASQYNISNIVLPGSPNAYVVTVKNPYLFPEGMTCQLPRQGTALPGRKYTRLRSLEGIKATLTQHSIRVEGSLTDFSVHSLCVEVKIDKSNSRYGITPERLLHLTLENEQGTIFADEMRVIRHSKGLDCQSFVLSPAEKNHPRFATRQYRSARMSLFPEPSLAFQHPLTGRRIELNVVDLSGLGLCVEVSSEHAMLISGMILPEIQIKLGSGFSIPGRGQVVYRKGSEEGKNTVRCGIALLAVDIQDHLRLLSLLQRARNRNSYLSTEVDIETLWEFFFETGFIYPSKYQQLAQRKEDFLETLRKTYLEQTTIARHFTYHAEGQIQAHLSAVRLYEQTWFQQHHAARRSGKRAVGFEVFKQLAEYFYSAFPISNDKIGYIASFSRPENRFPARYNQEIIKNLNNPKAASLDLFAYFENIPEFSDHWSWAEIPPSWQVARATKGDLVELNGFYEQKSGGCLIDALDLRPEKLERTVIEEEYHKLGMIRRRHLYSIKREKELMAVIELHESDTGLSFSRMDRVVMCYILGEELPPTLLSTLAQSLTRKLNLDNPPLLIYPQSYAANYELKYDKNYEMLILNMLHVEQYMIFMDKFITNHSSIS